MKYMPLLGFMLKRHEIYLKRARGEPFPWTKDSILRTYKFTNVYRELDRVTIWVRRNIREQYAAHPNLWFMLCVARQINWPPTLEMLMTDTKAWPHDETWQWARLMELMRERAAEGKKNYTGAYMLNAHGENRREIEGYGRFDKPLFTGRLVLQTVWEDRKKLEPFMHTTLERVTNALTHYFGWGPFMSYEVATDLRYTRYLRDAPDKLTWANAGPGARRGLARLDGTKLPSPSEALEQMQWLLGRIQPMWSYTPPLELREIEHSLCEFDKYERVRCGEGRPRSLFQPHTEELPA